MNYDNFQFKQKKQKKNIMPDIVYKKSNCHIISYVIKSQINQIANEYWEQIIDRIKQQFKTFQISDVQREIQNQFDQIQNNINQFGQKDSAQLIQSSKQKINQLIKLKILIQLKQIENNNKSQKHQYMKTLLDNIMKQFQIKNEADFKQVLYKKIALNNKKKDLFQSKNNNQKVKQTLILIQKLQTALRTFQQYQKVKLNLKKQHIEQSLKLQELENQEKKQQQLKTFIDNAMKQFQIKNEADFKQVLYKKIALNNKKKDLFQSKNNNQKVKQTLILIQKLQTALRTFQQYQKVKLNLKKNNNVQSKALKEKKEQKFLEEKKVQIDEKRTIQFFKKQNLKEVQQEKIFKLQPKAIKRKLHFTLQNKIKKSIEYDLNDYPENLLKQIGYINLQDIQVLFFDENREKYVILQLQKSFNESFQIYIDYKVIIKKTYSVKYQNNIKKYAEGTDLVKIKKDLDKQKGKYSFYDKDKRQYNQQQIKENLQMFEVQSCQIIFGDKVLKNFELPITLSFKNLVSYFDAPKLIPDSLTQIFFSEINIQNNWIKLNDIQQKSIIQISNGKDINAIKISYKIILLIQLFSKLCNTQQQFVINADQLIEVLKKKYESQCKLQQNLQQWMIDDDQLLNHQSFMSKGIFANRIRINVKQLKNLQYYGFSKCQPIQTQLYINYNIEDDSNFKQTIQKSNFPDQSYQYSFRVWCLQIIFSAIKKHSKIEMALKNIKKIIRQINLGNAADNQAKTKLWQSNSKNKICSFNQHYVLHNILLSSQDDLIIQLMKVYKHHSPLFLITFDQNGLKKNYFDCHFWINTKSFVITSLQIGDKIQGKSQLLNTLFNINIELKENRHPLCSKSVLINYNIYRNQDCLVDLIDASTDSMTEQEKIKICKNSNMIIIHYYTKDYQKIKKWLQLNCLNVPIILFERNNSISMDNTQEFDKQMELNNSLEMKKIYKIPQLNQINLKYYEHNIQRITDQIHVFVQQMSKRFKQNQNLFSQFLANNCNKINKKIIDILEQLQKNFTQIVDIKKLGQAIKKDNINQHFSFFMKKILNLIDQEQIIAKKFMCKLRQSVSSIRNKRLKQFGPINVLQKIVQIKDSKRIQTEKLQIKQNIQLLQKIDEKKKTLEFCQILTEIKKIDNYNNQNIRKLQKLTQDLNNIFVEQIKPREFSIQNFWRCLNKLFHSQQILPKQFVKYTNVIKFLFEMDFKSGKTFEVINGDNLIIPTFLLKCIEYKIQNKKVMVVGIFGPQSSGKSTLLNYIFGCDFASSDGRCTNGIYGTYYDITNSCLPFSGILVLDTEGLFSNYKRRIQKGQNFDNKLVLFLLKTCDIIIMNTRGDIDKNCQNILQISFDSVLMQHKQGAIYPNFYVVLNQSIGKMNIQQQNQVRQLRNKIISVNSQMQKYISTNATNSIPIAFNTSQKNINSEVLKRIQLKNKTPTDQFYKQTKQLSLLFMKILTQRSRINQPKVIMEIYDNMNAIWNSILNSPMLTMHATKLIKRFSEQIQNESFQIIKNFQNNIINWESQIPKFYNQIQDWQIGKYAQFKQQLDKLIQKLKFKFPHGPDFEKNSIISKCIQKVKLSMINYYESFKMKVIAIKMQLQFKQNKKRGVQGLMKIAKQLRKIAYRDNIDYNDVQKNQKFNNAWQDHIKILKDSINLPKITELKYKQVFEYYKNQLNLQKSAKIYLPDKFSIYIEKFFQQYSTQIKNQLLKSDKDNFYSYFESLNSQPIISIKKNSANSLSKQYLSMQQFFQLQPTTKNFYLNLNYCPYFFNQKQIKQQIINKIFDSQILKSCYQSFVKDVQHFNISVKDQYSLRMYLAKRFYGKYLSLTLNINEEELNQQKLDQIYFNSNKNKTKQAFKNYPKKPSGTLELNFFSHQFLIKSIEKQNFYFGSLCQYNILKQNLQKGLINYINKRKKHFFQKIETIIQQMKIRIFKKLKEIGLNINIDTSFVQYKILYENARNQYSIFNSANIRKCRPLLNFYLYFYKQKPLKYSLSSQLFDLIKNLPSFLQKKHIQNSIASEKQNENWYHIGYIQTQKTKIVKKHQNNTYLKNYINKEYQSLIQSVKTPIFKKFIFQHIKKQLIFEKIIKQIQNAHELTSLQNLVVTLLNFIKKQISKFNNDLRQISHQLSYGFIEKIHYFCSLLISKKLQLSQKEKILEKSLLIQSQKQKQKQLFLNLLNKDNLKRCRTNAKIFADSYEQFIIDHISKKKKDHLKQRKQLFLKKYKRREFQKIIDKQMQDCNDENIAYKYLMFPKTYLTQQYNKMIQEQIKTHLQKLNETQTIQNINQLKDKIKLLNSQLKGKQYPWEADLLFQNLSQQDNTSVILKNIFIQLISKKTNIDQKYFNNKFKLKKGIYFQNKIFLEESLNKFFLASWLNVYSFEIQNYAIFIKYLLEQIEGRINLIKQKQAFNQAEKQQFKVDVQIKFCLFDCPFCGRLCDIDIRQSPQHQIHQCSSGHQMRAIKNIKIQKKQNGKIINYASIMRCENINNQTLLEYNQIQKTWRDHKKGISDWSFDTKCERSQKMMFERLWSLAGQLICKQKREEGVDMLFLDFNQYDQKIKQDSIRNSHYIFSIDGSGSMRGQKWKTQILEISKILSILSSNINNKVSINIFTDNPNIVIKRGYADKINPMTFAFPGGATVYQAVAAFKGAIQIMQQTGLDIDTHFIYLSDGHGVYPDAQIIRILQLKEKLSQKGYSFTYTSILIGGSSRDGMDKINERMKGNNQWIDSPSKISNAFRQVYINKKVKY